MLPLTESYHVPDIYLTTNASINTIPNMLPLTELYHVSDIDLTTNASINTIQNMLPLTESYHIPDIYLTTNVSINTIQNMLPLTESYHVPVHRQHLPAVSFFHSAANRKCVHENAMSAPSLDVVEPTS
ncbi:hypothetical protein ACJMK2_010393 [Sinanodonta woodiana]|uniref:Uncharacterized protein n=1 Tax=Sinanodonta woodiana TaxID=1069815 RepID=A0ABD3VF72_SINWO